MTATDDGTGEDISGCKVIILVAKMGISAPPRAEMEALAGTVASRLGFAVRHAFSEQGDPALREVVLDLVAARAAEIAIVPVNVPVEPTFATWIARVTRRWQREAGTSWPPIRIGRGAASVRADVQDVVTALSQEALGEDAVVYAPDEKPEGSLVPPQKHRVLVCHGAPCHNAGAATIWGHLRNEAVRLNLREDGDGMMSAKTSCLGPCGLAPVVQVFPSGTYYGGVDEAGIDAIIAEDIVGKGTASAYAFAATGRKHRLPPK